MIPHNQLEPGYYEYPVEGPLRDHLVCIWRTVVPSDLEGPYVVRILPDACVDVVMVDDRPLVVAGPATLPMTVEFDPGTIIVGARFRPGWAPSWLGAEAVDLLNHDVDLFDLWGYAANSLWNQLGSTPSAAARLSVLMSFLATRVPAARPSDGVVTAAVSLLANADGATVGEVSRVLGVSERQLHRRFLQRVGYGPKTLHRILRLQRLLFMAEASRTRTYADLAAAAGYADQPHMAREIRELTGVSASELLGTAAGTLALSDLFKTAGMADA